MELQAVALAEPCECGKTSSLEFRADPLARGTLQRTAVTNMVPELLEHAEADKAGPQLASGNCSSRRPRQGL